MPQVIKGRYQYGVITPEQPLPLGEKVVIQVITPKKVSGGLEQLRRIAGALAHDPFDWEGHLQRLRGEWDGRPIT